MDVTFATSDVHPRDRLDYWREVACRAFVDLECEAPSRHTFRAKIRSSPFADLGLSIVESDPCEVRRTPRGIARSREDALLLSVQMAGRSTLTQDGRRALLNPGDFALYDTRRPYLLDVSAGTAQLVLKIPRKALEARLGNTSALTARSVVAASPLGGLTCGFLGGLSARTSAMEPWCEGALADQALDLIALACGRELRGGRPQISSAGAVALLNLKAAIESRLCDAALTPSRAAAAASISVRQANALLAREGTSLERHIIERRLQRCRLALEDRTQDHRSITEIALAWGFSSASHFSNRFKKAYGATPAEYRNSRAPKA